MAYQKKMGGHVAMLAHPSFGITTTQASSDLSCDPEYRTGIKVLVWL